MKLNLLKSMAVAALFAGITAGCINDDTYDVPDTACTEPNITANKTVEEIVDLASGTPQQYLPANGDAIEAYVTSSDERGNFFKTISMQTMPTDGSDPVGFSVAVDETSLFAKRYVPGRKVYVVLDSLYYATVDGSLKIGESFEGSIGRISEFDYAGKIIPSCTKVDENQLVRNLTIADALNDTNLNTLIELQNVQFKDEFVGGTYFDETDEDNTAGGATNRLLIDNVGNEIVFRTSSFANFSGNTITEKSGSIRGVLTKFGSTYQFVARYESDIRLDQDRMSVDFFPAIVGDAIVYSGSFTENFESYVTTSPQNRNFPKYINDPVIGGRYWANTTFGGNKYIQMSSFGGTAEANRTLFIIPVDMTAANGFSFQSKFGFMNGPALKVYYSMDYVPGGEATDATLVDITSSFTLSPGLSNGYPTNFTNSGTYAIPASLTGNGFFIFEYVGNGNGGVTTTVQIDNIVVN
ncbi:MAG TPA: DUF5689 domain-containing protein [Flavobacterium sp.]|jgi:hypothetical protein